MRIIEADAGPAVGRESPDAPSGGEAMMASRKEPKDPKDPKDPKEKKPAAGRRRKKKAEPASRGLTAAQIASGAPPAAIEALRGAIEAGGGSVLAAYRDPLGGNWHVLAGLPIDTVAPTPYQRDL